MKKQIKRFSKSTLAVVLTLCMLFSCFTVGIVATNAAQTQSERVGANASTVYFFNTPGWSTVKIHHWGGSAAGTSWSGNTMTQDNTYTKLYSYSTSSGYFTSCIFNDGSNQTGDLNPGGDGYIYSDETKKWFSHTLKTIYVKNTQEWTNVYLDLRDNSDDRYVKKWGGVKVLNNTSTADGEGYYNVTSVGNSTYKVEGYFGDVTKIILHNGSGTQTPDTQTFTENYVYDTDGSKTVYTPPETTYEVTVSAGTGGSVSSTSVNAGDTTAVALPTATADFGYKFKNWTASGGGVTITNETSATGATIKATGTGGTVTANFEENTSLTLYAVGRFAVKGGANTGGWSTNSTNLPFTRNGAFDWTLNTGYTLKELSGNYPNTSDKFYLRVYDGTNVYRVSDSSDYAFTDSNTSKVLASSGDKSISFNSTNENGTVVLHFDPRTKTISYELTGVKEALAAPTGLKLGGLTGNQTVDAAQGQNIALSWNAVSNAASYTVYKGSTKVAENITTTSYNIEKSYANGGTYTVIAYPASGSTTYMESAASADITLTVNRVKLTAPTVTTDKASYTSKATVVFTLSGTQGTAGTTFNYQRKSPSDSSFANLANGDTFTALDLGAGTYTYKFKAKALQTNYFTDSDEVTKTVTVAAPTTTLYVSKNISFTHAYIYNGGSNRRAWPGEAMNATPWTDEGDYYKLVFNNDWPAFMVILNDGTNNGSKTADMDSGDSKATGETYRIDSATGNQAVTIIPGAPLPALDAPTNVKLNNSTTAQTVSAAKGSKINLTWSAVTNAGSYTIYKDGEAVTTVTGNSTTTYAIEKGNSYSGTYTVVANPSDTSAYNPSAASTGIELTVNKVALARPVITLNKTAVNNTDTGVTVTVTNYDALKDACTFTLSGATAASSGAISSSGVYTITAYNQSAYDGADNSITVKATISSGNSDYYSIANATSEAAVLKVYKPDFALCGGVTNVTATGITTPSSDDWNNKSAFVIESTTQTPGVYSLVFTTTSDAYLGLRNSTDRYNVKVDGTSYNTYDKSYTIPNEGKSGMELITVSDGSMKFAGGKTYTITVNQTNNTVSVSTDSWNVTTVARYKDYNLATGTYKAVATGTTGGTAAPASASVKKGQTTTLTATPASGYTFTGWYTAEACTGTAASTSASYTVTPSADTTYYALFTKTEPAKVNISVANVTGATINATWNGTTVTNGQTLSNVPVGASVTVTVTPADNKYLISTTPALTSGKFTVTASTTSITATLGDKLKVNVSTNKAEWGTVTVDKAYAKPGDTVTITPVLASGTPKKITVTRNDTSAKIAEWTYSNGSFTGGSVSAAPGKAGESVGANTDELTFTMPSAAVSVAAEYEEYVGTSDYYYNYYSTSGKGTSAQMSEGSINGQVYGYYNVTDRTESDQLFTVSHRSTTSGTRYVYFTNNYNWDNLHVYFYNGVEWNWPGDTMSQYGDDGYGHTVYRYAIPENAKGVIFNNGQNGVQTQNINLTTTNGAYYLSGSSSPYTVVEWDSNVPSDAGLSGYTETEYFSTQNDQDIYPGSYQAYTNAGLFNDHGIGSTRVAKPKGDDFDDYNEDYYILVFYPGTTYTIDDDQFTPTGNPIVYWSSTLPGQSASTSSTIKVYAKDGAIRRDNDSPERNNMTYSTFEQHANTFVYSDSGYATHIGTRSSNDGQTSEGSTGYNGYTYDYVAKFEKGKTLYIETELDSTLIADYYLYGYSINGKTYKLHTKAESATGTVREAFTVPEDFEDKYLEITPIYFSTTTDYITFYVENYDEEVMNSGWGNTVGVYPYYQDNSNNQVANVNNPFGGYPGQPLVFYNGNYYTQLPKTIYANTEGGTQQECHIKGITLGNNYWDDIHKLTGEVSVHHQTYDFDDLYKIYKEYPDQASNIVCSFKYRNKYNNNEPASFTSASTYANGWEVLTDYYGRPIDVFGNILEGTAKTTAESIIANKTAASATGVVHVISQDYKSNCAGQYATEYAIYNTSGTKVTGGGKTTIVPSALAITETGHFANYDAQTRAFQGIYDALKADNNVVGQPVVITYEQSIWGGSDQAERCDARWYFSTTGQPITASVRIEYSDDMGKTWTTDEFTNTNEGTHSGTHAYFTGTATTATDTPETALAAHPTTASGTTGGGYYIFNAEPEGQYTFVGWYLLRDNYSAIQLKNQYDGDATQYPSHAEMSKNGDIFVARFMKTASGQFVIHHEVHPQSNGYGDVAVTAKVVDANNVEHSISSSSNTDVTVGNTYIVSNAGNKIVATFTATPYGTSTFVNFYATVQSLLQDFQDYDYIDSISINGTTATVTYDVDKMFTVRDGSPTQTVFAVTHYSRFGLNTGISYTLDYTFKTRYYGNKVYHYTSTLTEQELKSYYQDQITDKTKTPEQLVLSKQFVVAKAPFESNYREDLTWQVDNVNIDHTSATLTATQVDNTTVRAVVYDTTNGTTLQTTDLITRYMMLFDTTATAENVGSITPSADNLYQPKFDGKYISQWNMYQLDSFAYEKDTNGNALFDQDGNLVVSAKSKLVAVSYSSEFNYTGYEDYAIVPVYSDTFVNRQETSDNLNTSGATILTLTRNHWNQNAAGNTDNSSYKDGADRLYADFMLTYNYKGKQLSTTGDNIQVGFIVKAYTWDGNTKVYTKDSQGNDKATVIFINKNEIDNKNRLEYCYGIKNSDSNAKTWGKNFEFTPFVIDTENAQASGIDVKDGNTTYKSVYSAQDTQILDNVTFYVIANYA